MYVIIAYHVFFYLLYNDDTFIEFFIKLHVTWLFDFYDFCIFVYMF